MINLLAQSEGLLDACGDQGSYICEQVYEWTDNKLLATGADWLLDRPIRILLIAVLAPPPFPAKVFMLVAGIVGMSWTRFAGAIFVGRMIRFTGEAYLAVRLGDRAVETLRQHYPTVGATLALAVILYLAVKWVRKRRRLQAAG